MCQALHWVWENRVNKIPVLPALWSLRCDGEDRQYKGKYINKRIPVEKAATKDIKLMWQGIIRGVLTLDRMVRKVSRKRWCLSWAQKDGKKPIAWATKRKNHSTSKCKRPWVGGTVCQKALDFLHTHWLIPPLLSCFSDSALQCMWGSSLGSLMVVPFWYINLKLHWESSSFSTYLPQAISCSWWLRHSVKRVLDFYIILIFFFFFCVRFCLRA